MRKILFLDFDGVLHADVDPKGNFSKFPLLEQYLLKMSDIEIVISSSWRESYSFEELKEFFPVKLRDRIIGITPILEDGFDHGGRQREIEAFLEAASLNPFNASWVALDDWAALFDDGCPYLIWVNPARGFGKDEGRILVKWHNAGKRHCL